MYPDEYNPVFLRLTVEGIKYNVQHAFMQHELQLREIINKALDKEISAFNLEKLVEEEVKRLLPELIHETLQYHIRTGMQSESVQHSLKSIVDQSIRSYFEKRT